MNRNKVAYFIAKLAHKNQLDRVGKPYIYHPIRVSLKVKSVDEKIVALLHDVVEDTDVTLDDLCEIYEYEIVAAIDAITKRDTDHYKEYLQRVKENFIALPVKLADIEDNLDKTRLPEEIPDWYYKLSHKYKQAREFLNAKD